ncbi:MAG: AsmA family protein, partial [Saprospiraceae bacterium]
MTEVKPSRSLGRKILRITLIVLSALLVLVAAAIYALTLPAVQQKITRKAESFLREKLGTRVEVGAVRLRFPYKVSLDKFLLEDQQGDTLARVGSLVVTMDMWKLLDQTIELQQITLEDAGIYLYRKDSIYNFDFVTKAFANPDTMAVKPVDTTASPWKLRLDLAVLQLKSVDFLLQDEDSQSTTHARIGTAETTIEKADLKNLNFELDGFTMADSEIRLIQRKKSVDDGKPSPAFGLLLKDGDIQRSHLVFSTTELALDANLEKTQLDNLELHSANDVLAIQAKGVR